MTTSPADSTTLAPKTQWQQLKQNAIFKEMLSLLHALGLVLIIRTFVYQPFVIPSESMYPTLIVGDFLFVNKFSYGYGNRTFPLADYLFENKPWSIATRLMPRELKRGDVVVFHNPKHIGADGKPEALDYIKRLMGLPGDRIQVKQGLVYINGVPVKLDKMEDYEMVNAQGRYQLITQYMETLPNGIKHPILKYNAMGAGWLDDTEEYVVPEGHYFMMGDNRDNSKDSRVLSDVGYVPLKNIIGRADVIFLSTEGEFWKPWTWPKIRFSRLPHLIK